MAVVEIKLINDVYEGIMPKIGATSCTNENGERYWTFDFKTPEDLKRYIKDQEDSNCRTKIHKEGPNKVPLLLIYY